MTCGVKVICNIRVVHLFLLCVWFMCSRRRSSIFLLVVLHIVFCIWCILHSYIMFELLQVTLCLVTCFCHVVLQVILPDFEIILQYLQVFFFRFSPTAGGGGAQHRLASPAGKPILFALGPMGAAIVTNFVLKPHAEACCFALFYNIVAIASLC